MNTLGIVGAGAIGTAVARAALSIGYNVVLSNSRGVATLSEVVRELGPAASPATLVEAVSVGDLVLIATPLHSHAVLPAEAFADTIVIDACNYYAHRDGDIADLLADSITSSERLQAFLPSARVVKAFNIINAAEILSTAAPAGTTGRRALPIAGDDPEAKAIVADFIDAIGFDVVDIGTLAESWRIQPRTPGYIVHSTEQQLRERVASAERVVPAAATL